MKITVCAECLTASCWHGEIMCWDSKTADVVELERNELDQMAIEHPSHYAPDKLYKVTGDAGYLEEPTP